MLRTWRQAVGILVFIISTTVLSSVLSAAEVPQHVWDSHDAAVKKARNGDVRGGLQALDSLISEYPEFYPAKRDYVIIATWAEDCEAALQAFDRIKAESPLEGYLVEPVAECLRDRRLLDEALLLLETAVSKNPNDADA